MNTDSIEETEMYLRHAKEQALIDCKKLYAEKREIGYVEIQHPDSTERYATMFKYDPVTDTLVLDSEE